MISIASLQVGTKIRFTSRGKSHTGTIKSLHTDESGAICWVRVGTGTVNVAFVVEVVR
jgi:hypothetical protein